MFRAKLSIDNSKKMLYNGLDKLRDGDNANSMYLGERRILWLYR